MRPPPAGPPLTLFQGQARAPRPEAELREVSEPARGTAPRPRPPGARGAVPGTEMCVPAQPRGNPPALPAEHLRPPPAFWAAATPLSLPGAGTGPGPGQRRGGPGLCKSCSAGTVRSGPDREAGSAPEGCMGLSGSRREPETGRDPGSGKQRLDRAAPEAPPLHFPVTAPTQSSVPVYRFLSLKTQTPD